VEVVRNKIRSLYKKGHVYLSEEGLLEGGLTIMIPSHEKEPYNKH